MASKTGWVDSITYRHCPGCKADRKLQMFRDTPSTDHPTGRYWICRSCWTHIPIPKGKVA